MDSIGGGGGGGRRRNMSAQLISPAETQVHGGAALCLSVFHMSNPCRDGAADPLNRKNEDRHHRSPKQSYSDRGDVDSRPNVVRVRVQPYQDQFLLRSRVSGAFEKLCRYVQLLHCSSPSK